ALVARSCPDAENVDERSPRVAHRLEDFLQAPPAVVLDDDAGAGTDVGLEPGIGAPRVADRDRDAGLVETPRQRPGFDDELHFEAGQEDFVQHPDDQFVLTDGQTPHWGVNKTLYGFADGAAASQAVLAAALTVLRLR